MLEQKVILIVLESLQFNPENARFDLKDVGTDFKSVKLA